MPGSLSALERPIIVPLLLLTIDGIRVYGHMNCGRHYMAVAAVMTGELMS
jgi:hypothetical protein